MAASLLHLDVLTQVKSLAHLNCWRCQACWTQRLPALPGRVGISPCSFRPQLVCAPEMIGAPLLSLAQALLMTGCSTERPHQHLHDKGLVNACISKYLQCQT